jgi:hypothetical protein
MPTSRVARTAIAAAVASVAIAATAPAADPALPTGTLTATITPKQLQKPPANGHGTPLSLKVVTTFKQPAGTIFVLKKIDYLFPKGAVTNGNVFPSCKASVLQAAHGALNKCPAGSKIGSGVATGTAVEIPVTSTGKITIFNGPGGKSVTVNIKITNPAQINETFSSPLKKLKGGKYGYRSTINVPPRLQEILDGPIVVKKLVYTLGASRTIKGVKRGYIEGVKCPKNGKAPFHAEYFFKDAETQIDATTVTDTVVKCTP